MELGAQVGSGLAAVGCHAQPVAKRVTVDVEVALESGDRLGGGGADDRGRPERQVGPLPATELDLHDSDGMGDHDLDRTVRRRTPEPRLRVERFPVAAEGPLRVGDEGFAVVGKRDPLAIVERVAATPMTLPFALPCTEEVGEATEIGMNGLIGRHAPSVAWAAEAPASALATIVLMSEIDGIERVLVVVAHPDDCDFGCAGTTARWTDAGVNISYLIVTDGDAGGFDRTITRKEMATIRRREQTEAAAEVGVTDLTFLGYPDGRLTPSIELRRDIARVIRTKQPQRVITQSPVRNFTRIFASHPDHLAVGEATLCAVYPDARNPFAHSELLEQEGLEPYSVADVWMSAAVGSAQDTQVVDVTDTAERKLAALRCHRSQYSDWDALEQRVRGWLDATAKMNGLEPGRLAEQYVVVPTT
jgi:LmbE family N-acetylglucosaminyl deacetylase